jgi:hypothetical protein
MHSQVQNLPPKDRRIGGRLIGKDSLTGISLNEAYDYFRKMNKSGGIVNHIML